MSPLVPGLLALALVADDPRAVDLRSLATPLGDTWGQAETRALASAVGDSRVVCLGEITHGDGTSFHQKVQAVKALHESLGFDVLIWESGLYDCAEMDAALPGDRPIEQVARLGVFAHWSAAVESLPVFEYARKSHGTARPLRMAGFDIQASGSASNSLFPDILSWFGDRPELTADDRAAVSRSFDLARAASSAADPAAAFQEAQLAVHDTAPRFLRAYESNPTAFRALWGDATDLRVRILRSAASYGQMLRQNAELQAGKRPFHEPYNLRERANAENLLWLVNERYRGHKVIVWAHNLHILRAQPTSGARRAPADRELESMGRLVGESLGDDLYVLGVLCGGGQWAWLGNPPIDMRAPTAGSLESLLGAAGLPVCFLNLRTLPADHWLRRPIAATLDQQNTLTVEALLPQSFDGVLYVPSMKPRTQR